MFDWHTIVIVGLGIATTTLVWQGALFFVRRGMKQEEDRRADDERLLAPTVQLPPELFRFAGRLIDNRWPKEVIDEIKKEYFPLPPVKQQYLTRADLTGTCPLGHATSERIGLLAPTAKLANSFSSALHKERVEITCKECGKVAKVNGRTPVWEGTFDSWDGAT